MFDRAEFLIAMQFAHRRLSRMAGRSHLFWTPTGRFVWKTDENDVMNRLKQIQSIESDDEILKGGLLGGNVHDAKEAADAVIEFLKQIPRLRF